MKKIIIICLFLFTTSELYSDPLKMKKQKIADQLAEIKVLGGDHLGYAGEILRHLERMKIYPSKKIIEKKRPYWRRWQRDRERVDAYSILSGGLAIRESLQLESILSRASSSQVKDVDITTLKGLEIKSHPFEKMLAGREYKFSQLAKYCPENFYYFYFNNMSSSLDFFDYLGEVGGSLYKRYVPHSVDFKLKEKILTQLALKENKTARRFYSSVIDEMAIIGSDPFLIEGTDVTLIYKLKIPLLFKTTIYNYRKGFQQQFNAHKKEINIKGARCEYLYSADRKINSYLLTLKDGTVIISNSKAAVARVLAVYSKKINSLADAADFKYMRSIYPLDKNKEDGFLYLSDSFVRYLVGPTLRIKEARRLRETMQMAKLEKYIIYYYQVYNKYPESIEDIYELIKLPPLGKELNDRITRLKQDPYYKVLLENRNKLYSWYDLYYRDPEYRKAKWKEKRKIQDKINKFINEFKSICQEIEGRSPYRPEDALRILENALNPAEIKMFNGLQIGENHFSAVSKIYGRNGYLLSNLDKDLKLVSKEEAGRYKDFVRRYSNYWREFFDPIGIRFKMKNGIKVETCILPLINNSFYNVLTRVLGGQPVQLKDNNLKGEVLSLSYKINNKLFSHQLQMFFKDLPQNSIPDNLFGNQVHIHMLDRFPLFDFDSSSLMSHMMRSNMRSREIYIGFLIYAFFHPMRVSYQVNDKDKAEQLLLLLNRKIATNTNPYLFRSAKMDTYYYKYKTHLIHVFKIDFYNMLKFRLYFSVVNNAIEITTTKAYMDKIIDSADYPAIESKKTELNNIRLVYRPGQMREEKDLFKFNLYESAQKASFKNIATIKLLKNIFPEAKNLQQKCLDLYNFKPVCPMGGQYIINKKNGRVRNSIFGSPGDSYMLIDKIKSDVTKRYFNTNEIRVELKFTKEGIMTRIVTE